MLAALRRAGLSIKELDAGVPFLGRLPLSLAIREASDAGQPLAAEADSFGTIADRILESLNQEG